MRVSSRAIVFVDGKLLTFFRRKRKGDKLIEYYAIPGGGVEEGESLEETVVRELREEMNLKVEVVKYLGKLTYDDLVEHYYYCKVVGGKLQFGGEEVERNSADNFYRIELLDPSELDKADIKSIKYVKAALKLRAEGK